MITIQDLKDSLEIKEKTPKLYSGVTGLHFKEYIPFKEKIEEIDFIMDNCVREFFKGFEWIDKIYVEFFTKVSMFKMYANFDYDEQILGNLDDYESEEDKVEEVTRRAFKLYDLITELGIFDDLEVDSDIRRFRELTYRTLEERSKVISSTALQVARLNDFFDSGSEGLREALEVFNKIDDETIEKMSKVANIGNVEVSKAKEVTPKTRGRKRKSE